MATITTAHQDDPKKIPRQDSNASAQLKELKTLNMHETFPTTRQPYCQPGLRGVLSSRYITLCAIFAAMGGLLFGYDQGVVSVILVEPQFLQRFTRIDETSAAGGSAGFWKGLLTAMIELGALLGALNQGWIADKYSRKYSIVIAVVVFTVGSVLQTAAMDYAMLVVARFIGGLGIGMLSMVAPLYISEISPPEIRGSLLVLEEFSIVTGIVIAFWITYGTYYMSGEWAWRLPFLIQIIPGLVLGIGILFLPFSPRWLVSKGRDEEALLNLAKLRQLPPTDHRVQLEWFDIRAEVALHKEINAERHPHLQERTRGNRIKLEVASWADLFKKGCLKRTHIGVGIMFFQQFVGLNTPPCLETAALILTFPGRHQRSNLLLPHSLQELRLRLQHATHHVRCPEHHATRRCHKLSLDNGQARSPATTPHRKCSNVRVASGHLRARWAIFR